MKSRRAKKILGILIVAGLIIYFQEPISEVLQSVSRPFVKLDPSGLDPTLRPPLTKGRVGEGSIWEENLQLKEILNRKPPEENFILAVVLAKPNRSPYDTLIIDIGAEDGILVGQKVFAYGDILIGELAEVYGRTSKVRLFSTPGEKTEVVLGGEKPTPGVKEVPTPGVGFSITLEATGRGGGNFELTLPNNLAIEKGQAVSLPGIRPYILGTVEKIISDERDPLQKILIRSLVNLFELKFVEVELTAK